MYLDLFSLHLEWSLQISMVYHRPKKPNEAFFIGPMKQAIFIVKMGNFSCLPYFSTRYLVKISSLPDIVSG